MTKRQYYNRVTKLERLARKAANALEALEEATHEEDKLGAYNLVDCVQMAYSNDSIPYDAKVDHALESFLEHEVAA